MVLANDEKGIDRLCIVYEQLDSKDRGEVIRLAEVLLNAQRNTCDERTRLAEVPICQSQYPVSHLGGEKDGR